MTLMASLAARNDFVTLFASKSIILIILSQEAVYIILEVKLTAIAEIGSMNLYTFSQIPEETFHDRIVQSFDHEYTLSTSVATIALILFV